MGPAYAFCEWAQWNGLFVQTEKIKLIEN